MTLLTYLLWWGAAVLLSVALLLTTTRLLAGPSTLDRLVSLDTLAAIGQCTLGLYIAWTLDTTPAAAVMALALISFVGSIAVARFRVRDDHVRGDRARGGTVDGRVAVSGTEDGEGR